MIWVVVAACAVGALGWGAAIGAALNERELVANYETLLDELREVLLLEREHSAALAGAAGKMAIRAARAERGAHVLAKVTEHALNGDVADAEALLMEHNTAGGLS